MRILAPVAIAAISAWAWTVGVGPAQADPVCRPAQPGARAICVDVDTPLQLPQGYQGAANKDGSCALSVNPMCKPPCNMWKPDPGGYGGALVPNPKLRPAEWCSDS